MINSSIIFDNTDKLDPTYIKRFGRKKSLPQVILNRRQCEMKHHLNKQCRKKVKHRVTYEKKVIDVCTQHLVCLLNNYNGLITHRKLTTDEVKKNVDKSNE